jgi:hypothetical protein
VLRQGLRWQPWSLPAVSLLGHRGDCGGIAGDGQVRPEGFLGGVQVVARMPVADDQVGTMSANWPLNGGNAGKAR